jgi:copper chaperone CopZ
MMRMRKLVSAILVGLMVLAMSAGAALAAEKTYKLKVVGLLCAKDTVIVGSMLDETYGVKDYELSMDETAVVTFDDEVTSLEEIDAKLDKQGYGINSAEEITE